MLLSKMFISIQSCWSTEEQMAVTKDDAPKTSGRALCTMEITMLTNGLVTPSYGSWEMFTTYSDFNEIQTLRRFPTKYQLNYRGYLRCDVV